MKFISSTFISKQIAESGQSFRWYPVEEAYIIVANHQVALLRQRGEVIEVTSLHGSGNHWHDYFDLSQDYEHIIDSLKGQFSYLDQAIDFGKGIRILRQDAYEMIMTFMISANNNIKRITQSIQVLSERYGTLLCEYNGKKYYDFPSFQELQHVSINDFRDCGVGYRDKYLFEFIQALNHGLDMSQWHILNDDELKDALLRLKGVGEKVANCIMLFGYYRINQFPIDTWIRKVLIEGLNANPKALEDFVRQHFNKYGGMAQQYLFYYGRLGPKNIS